MKHAVLIHPSALGRRRGREIDRTAQILREAGVLVSIQPTTHAGSACEQTKHAAMVGFDTIIACGGDGTANEVLNGIMTSPIRPVMGVLPFGTGNLLASELHLPRDPAAAARELLLCRPRPVRPGILTSGTGTSRYQRYFTVSAGAGLDAMLIRHVKAKSKERFGLCAYLLAAGAMLAKSHYPLFQVESRHRDGKCIEVEAVLAIAIRVGGLNGMLRFAKFGTTIIDDDFHVIVIRPGKRRSIMKFLFGLMMGRDWRGPEVLFTRSTSLRCVPKSTKWTASTQTDGELCGELPIELSLSEKSFDLLMPLPPTLSRQ